MSAIDGVGGLGAAFLGASGNFKDRLRGVLGTASGQRDALAVLRLAKPVLSLERNLVACYDGNCSILVSRAADFHAVIARQTDFHVVYGPRMQMLTGGRDFFLGMQDGPDYRRDTEAMARIVRPADLDGILAMARSEARAALAGTEIDLPVQLSAHIPALMVQRYFGVEMEINQLIADATAMFFFLFSDLTAEPRVTAAAMAAKDRVNAAIQSSRATAGPETLLGRAIAAGAAGDPAFDDEGIRANIIGILIGAIPTLSKAAVFSVEELLRRPDAMAGAHEAAIAGDEDAVAAHIWEALRFNPVNPIIYRRAAADTQIAGEQVKKGAMLLASNLSAMHDDAVVKSPRRFIAGRPREIYCLWGEGLHRCWGDRINRAILPAMLMPLFARPALRALAPPDGGGTPFPSHYRLAFNP